MANGINNTFGTVFDTLNRAQQSFGQTEQIRAQMMQLMMQQGGMGGPGMHSTGVNNTFGTVFDTLNRAQQSFQQTSQIQAQMSQLQDQMNAQQMNQQINQMMKSHMLKTATDELNNMQANQQLVFGLKTEFN